MFVIVSLMIAAAFGFLYGFVVGEIDKNLTKCQMKSGMGSLVA